MTGQLMLVLLVGGASSIKPGVAASHESEVCSLGLKDPSARALQLRSSR